MFVLWIRYSLGSKVGYTIRGRDGMALGGRCCIGQFKPISNHVDEMRLVVVRVGVHAFCNLCKGDFS